MNVHSIFLIQKKKIKLCVPLALNQYQVITGGFMTNKESEKK